MSQLSRRDALGAALLLPLAVSGCASPSRKKAVPSQLTARAQPAVPDVRFFPERDPLPFMREMLLSYDRERAALGHNGPLPPAAYLTVSGGGGDGAYGAGLLCGWTEARTRPVFKLVTGISTGALIAPFAFAGAKYDPVLLHTYTEVTDKDIFKKRNFTAALFKDAMANTRPMGHLVEQNITRELLDDIAAEFAKGRLMFIGTTNLDSREPVYWNMGALASSKDPAALELFHKITLASAAIPGAFPPVMIDVTVDGQSYQEMHVDGGATRQVFLYPRRVHLAEFTRQRGDARQRTLYIIRNSRLDPEWASVDRRVLTIANRAVSSLIQTQGMGDLDRIYMTATRDGIDYNLAFIPKEFNTPKKSEFDTAYMKQLFEYGRRQAAGGYPWAKYPPGYSPDDEVAAP
ncbi:patatin-like phospholipase family protein [Phenylobacterium sp. LjRoot219]|uniref:patatin-like phospholipase family protein n=1 Tax=Phenylobacterium sp. LjRoot219 TaxID=3342283 RepID=UPI003ECD2A60